MTGEARRPADEEAVTWFVLLRDSEATAADRARFVRWLEADPRHRKAWAEVEAMWSGMEALRPGGAVCNPLTVRRGFERTRAGLRGWQRFAAIAATIVLLLGVSGGVWSVQPPGFATALFADYRTGTGERDTVVLADGSVVALAPGSALSVSFEDDVRRVVLHHGQAYFTVVGDADRPFEVAAADGTATAVGTEFDVKVSDTEVGVAVASGIVDVAAGAGTPVRLTKGRGIRYGADGVIGLRSVEVADVGSWRNDRLVFQGAPLGEVLGDLDRYRRGRILVLDDAVGDLPVTGVFDTRRPDAALETIARTLPVHLVRVSGLLVLVRGSR